MRLMPLVAVAGLAAAITGCDDGATVVQAQPEAAEPGSALFVVGDSLSDTGNAAAVADYLLGQPLYPEATIGLCNPGEQLLLDRDCSDLIYGRSRVSDGPVAVEHLAAHLGAELEPSFHTVPDRPVVGANYAVAGAKARGTTPPRDLAYQLDRLLLDHGPLLPAGSVVVLMIGGNDAIDALQAAALPALEDPGDTLQDPTAPPTEPPPGGADAAQIIAEAAGAVSDAASRLLDAGACVIATNVPNLARLPAVSDTAELEEVDVAAAMTTAAEITTGLNADLAERLAALAGSHPNGASLVPFDFNAHFEAALEAAAAAGSNVTDACFDSETYAGSTAGERDFHAECAPAPGGAPGFADFFFWDGIHPSGASHAALGTALIDAFETGCLSAAP